MEQELKHYGVLGMKWGKRKADYLHKKASNLAGRRMASDQLATGYNVMSNRASNEWTKRGTSSYAKSYQKKEQKYRKNYKRLMINWIKRRLKLALVLNIANWIKNMWITDVIIS